MSLLWERKGCWGHDLWRSSPARSAGLDLPRSRLLSFESVLEVVGRISAGNRQCAAYTDEDGCETQAELAMQVNGEGVAILAMAAKESGAKLVQVSTDYVFDGGKGAPYLEDDPYAPLSFYGESKLAGELNARFAPGALNGRTMAHGLQRQELCRDMHPPGAGKGRTGRGGHQFGIPPGRWILPRYCRAHRARLPRRYHAANSGFCTWNEFARTIFAEAGLPVRVNPLSTEKWPAARLPLYSTLHAANCAGYRFQPQPGRIALRHYLPAVRQKRRHNLRRNPAKKGTGISDKGDGAWREVNGPVDPIRPGGETGTTRQADRGICRATSVAAEASTPERALDRVSGTAKVTCGEREYMVQHQRVDL